MDFWTFDRYITSNVHDYQGVIRVRKFWTQGTEVYSTTDNYLANGYHGQHEVFFSQQITQITQKLNS